MSTRGMIKLAVVGGCSHGILCPKRPGVEPIPLPGLASLGRQLQNRLQPPQGLLALVAPTGSLVERHGSKQYLATRTQLSQSIQIGANDLSNLGIAADGLPVDPEDDALSLACHLH